MNETLHVQYSVDMRNAWVVLVLAGWSCGSSPISDGGHDEPDAGTREDAGQSAVSLQVTADELVIHLSWDAAVSVEEWLIFRDGDEVARLSASTRTWDDLSAEPGRLRAFEASATIDLPHGIELEWATPTSAPGPSHTYRLRTPSGPASNAVTASRSAPRLSGFRIERGDGGWSFDAGATAWLDETAPSPSVFVAGLSVTAIPNDQTTSVVLRASADAGRTLTAVQYRIIANAPGAPSTEKLVTGARGGHRVEYQWQRSSGDSPTDFTDLPYVHGLTWLDPDAVLSEGRSYRLAARVPGQEWLSAPVRAELRRPVQMVGSGRGRNSFILRDDGVSLSLRYPRPLVQFPPLLQFFSFGNNACGLLLDAGIECDDGTGNLVSLNLPPAQSATGTDDVLWVGLVDGGVDGYGSGLQFPRRANLLDASRVIAGDDMAVCGSRADGGVRCAFARNQMFDPFVEVATTGTGFWMSGFGTFTVSDERGNTTRYGSLGATPGPLPAEDAGYVNGSEIIRTCGVRTDGLVRCMPDDRRAFNPPVSADRYLTFTNDVSARCGLTLDHRVRCLAEQLPHVPPRPPVKELQVRNGDLLTLLDEGLIDARGHGTPVELQESSTDRFVALSPRWISDSQRRARQCALRADGVTLCGNHATVPPGSRYSQISTEAGLLRDGGVESFVGDGGPSWPGQTVLELKEQPEADITCARFTNGTWSCSPAATLPVEPLSSISLASATTGCGLTSRGLLRCWPAPAPPSMEARHYQHVFMTPSHLCGTTLDGEVLCVTADGQVLPPLEWDDFVEFQQSTSQGCGIRRDRTVACRTNPLLGRPPWAP